MIAQSQEQRWSLARNGIQMRLLEANYSLAGAIGFPRARPSFDTVLPRELGTMAVTSGAAEKKSHAHY
jgi:hypothetical protein